MTDIRHQNHERSSRLSLSCRRGVGALSRLLLGLILFFAVLPIAQSEETVRVGNKRQSLAEIERRIIEHATKQKIPFDFTGLSWEFVRYTNSDVAVSLSCKHPIDGSFFYGRVQHNGAVSCDLTAPLIPSNTNLTVRLGMRRKTLAEVERLILQHAQKRKSGFDFKGADVQFIITTRSPGTIYMSFQRGDWSRYWASVDWRGDVKGDVMAICGGVR